jgi:hypothetical protein
MATRAATAFDERVLGFGAEQDSACLGGKLLGLVPLIACHRQQAPFAQQGREGVGRTDLPDADTLLEERLRAVKVPAQQPGQPLQRRGCRSHDARRGEQPCGLVRVGTHLLDASPAHEGAEHGGPRLGGGVAGPCRGAVLPVIDRVGPAFGLGRRDHRDDRAGVVAGEAIDQCRTADRSRPDQGAQQLRGDKIEHRLVRIQRPPGVLSCHAAIHPPVEPPSRARVPCSSEATHQVKRTFVTSVTPHAGHRMRLTRGGWFISRVSPVWAQDR